MFGAARKIAQMPRMPMDGATAFEKFVEYFLPIFRVPQIKVNLPSLFSVLPFAMVQKISNWLASLHRYTKSGQLTVAGFSDPLKDPLEEDTNLWMPNESEPPTDLDLTQARYLLDKVGDEFCKLNMHERIAKNNEHMSTG